MENGNTCTPTTSDFSKINELLEKRISENRELLTVFGDIIQRISSLDPMDTPPEEGENKDNNPTHLYKLSDLSENLNRQNIRFNYLINNLKRMV
jgi:hypothetical protein